MKTTLCIFALALAAWLPEGHRSAAQESAAHPGAAGDQLLGEWWTEGNLGRVRFSRDRDGTYRGTTTCCVHVDTADSPMVDRYNPNPKQRSRSTLGIVLMWKLKYDDGEYVDGYVYNPRDGKTYRMEVKLIDRDTLRIHGYVGISLFGQSQIWKRAQLPAAR